MKGFKSGGNYSDSRAMIKNFTFPRPAVLLVLAVAVAVIGAAVALAFNQASFGKGGQNADQSPTTQLPTSPPQAGQPPADQRSAEELQKRCQQQGGKWLAEFNECEGVDREACAGLAGSFNSCASACRHDPQTEVCTEQCVQVCSFGATSTVEPDKFNGSLRGLPTAPSPDLTNPPEIIPEGGVE